MTTDFDAEIEELASNSFVSSYTIYPKSELPHTIYVGCNKIEVVSWASACEIFIKANIKEHFILDLLDSLLLNYGGNIEKHIPPNEEKLLYQSKAVEVTADSTISPHSSPMFKVTNSREDSKIWSTINCFLGVNDHQQRVIVIYIHPSPVASQTLAKLQQALLVSSTSSHSHHHSDYENFAMSVFEAIAKACFESSVTTNKSTSTPPLSPIHYSEHIVDIPFVRDLQLHFAQKQTNELIQEAKKLDEKLKTLELKTAKFMTILKPIYQRAHLYLPNIPIMKPLADYPLLLTQDSIRDYSFETTRLCLLKARKAFRTEHPAALLSTTTANLTQWSTTFSGGGSTNEEEHHFVMDYLKTYFVQWYEEEYTIRYQRKVHSIQDRVNALHTFKLQCIYTLANRHSLVSGSSSGSGHAAGGTENHSDVLVQQWIDKQFIFLQTAPTDVSSSSATASSAAAGGVPTIHHGISHLSYLLECLQSQVQGKRGIIYLTIGYLLFTTNASPLATTSMFFSAFTTTLPTLFVVPLHTVVRLELIKGHKLAYSHHYAPTTMTIATDTSSSTTEEMHSTTSQEHMQGGGGQQQQQSYLYDHYLRLFDSAGQEIQIRFFESGIVDYMDRFVDVLDLILKDKLYIMRETTPTTNSSGSSHQYPTPDNTTSNNNKPVTLPPPIAPPAAAAAAAETKSVPTVAASPRTGVLPTTTVSPTTPMTPPPPPVPQSTTNSGGSNTTANSPLLDLSYFMAFSPQSTTSTTSTATSSSTLPRIDSSELLLDLENAISATANHQSTHHNSKLLSFSSGIHGHVDISKRSDDSKFATDTMHATVNTSLQSNIQNKQTELPSSVSASASANNDISSTNAADTSTKEIDGGSSNNNKPRNLGANIQKFLQKSQQTKQ